MLTSFELRLPWVLVVLSPGLITPVRFRRLFR